ncbi:hypothetical protein ACN47E_003428 [Coniothyrium glycines]
MSSSKAYPGSCHCGKVQYQVKLKFPPDMVSTQSGETIRIYKCNCTTCQKMGFFHCRPISPAEDFILTSPADVSELGAYRVYSKTCGWFFCKDCGVRVLGTRGEWEHVDRDIASWTGTKQDDEEVKMHKVWKLRDSDAKTTRDGKDSTKPFYLSVNAVTLEPGEDIDLTKWHENGWVFYVENLRRENGTQLRLEKAFEGGMY